MNPPRSSTQPGGILTAPKLRLGYARQRLSQAPVANLQVPANVAAEMPARTELGPPRAWPLLYWLNRAGRARYRYRLLQGLALGLAIDESALYWLAHTAAPRAGDQVRLLASTLFWSVGLGVVAGWVLLGGWFDDTTRAMFAQLAQRRGYSAPICRYLETMASWRWLATLLAFPSLAFVLVAAVRVSTPVELGALTCNLLLALLFTQLTAACIIGAVAALRPLEPKQARRIWLLACLLPELLRPILPGLPTLRVLATTLQQALLRWGAGG
jgi:hypothetical protein